MLKHLKLKASILQQRTTVMKHPGDDGLLKENENKKSEDILPEDDRRNNQDMYPLAPVSSDHLDSTVKPHIPCAKDTYISSCEKSYQQSEGFPIGGNDNGRQADTRDWRNLSSAHFDSRAPINNDHLYSTFRTTCSDPICYCLPKHIHPFSSKYEEGCSCMSCQQYPRVDHHNPLSYFPVAAPQVNLHHHHREGHILCSPEQALPQHKPLCHSPFSHNAIGWSKYANYETNCFRHLPNLNAKHCYHSWMHPECHSFRSPRNYQSNASEEHQKLSLPLSRSTIFSVVKSGNYETILQALDSPLHDEASPLYPLALQTVLDILDVIEKDFSDVYRKDSKVEADINLLSNFVKSMKMSTCGESSKSPDASENFIVADNDDREVTIADQSTEFPDLSSPAPICPDVHSVCVDASEAEVTIVDSREHILSDELPMSGSSVNSTANKHVSNISVKPLAQHDKPSSETGDVESNNKESEHEHLTPGDIMKKPDELKPGTTVQFNKCEDYSKGENDCRTYTLEAVECVDQNEREIHSNRILPVEEKPVCDTVIPSCESVETVNPEQQKYCSHQEGKHENKRKISESPSNKNHVPLSSETCSDTANLKNKVENAEEKTYDIDVVDALLDQTLYEASNQKDKAKHCFKKSISEESSMSGTTYRGKGYKVRPAGAASKTVSKSKLSVKTFAQIREKQSLSINCGLDETGADNSTSTGGEIEKKDENGNVVHILPLVDSEKKESDNTSNQYTQDIGKSPSNPSSPSDSLDCPDLRSLLEKPNTCSSHLARSESDVSSKGDFSKTRSGIEALNAIRNLPLPKEPSLSQSGVRKPLRTKSFHGKLLILRQSTEPPHPIPLEVTDNNVVLRDPRLSLSNLMDHRRNFEMQLLQWKEMRDDKSGKENPVNISHNSSAVNVRDPRIRRHLSEEMKETISITSTKDNSVYPSTESTALEEVKLPENTNTVKLAKSIDDSNVKPLPCNSSKFPNDRDIPEPSNGRRRHKSGSVGELIPSKKTCTSEQKVTLRTGHSQKRQLLSTVGSSQQSLQKVDTLSRFKESLSLLKIIKSDIKKQAANVMETAGKNDDLIERLSCLRREVELNLSTAEDQKKKASGKRLTTLTGLLEDHFILCADIIILTLWLEGFDSSIKNIKELPEFTEGVFGHDTAPSLRKIYKWIKNRYELDGLVDERLSKLVSSFGEDRGSKRSRSRSSSAGTSSDKTKRRRSESSRERHEKEDMTKKSHDGSKVKDADKSNPPPFRKKRKGSTQSKSDQVNSVAAVVSSSESDKGKGEKQLSEGSENSDGYEGKSAKHEKEVESKCKDGDKKQDKEMTPAKKRNQNVSANKDTQDLPQKMESIKEKVLIALRTRKTKLANRCLKNLTELSTKAHAQLEDKNKTYTLLQNVSPGTKARCLDVVKGIQRLLVDCQILIYSLSWKANKKVGRKAKDKIWNMAEKSSSKPSYEEELAFLLSLRKCYLSQELWKHIKKDVDDRIASMQKKCRSREQGSNSVSMDDPDYSKERNPSERSNRNSNFTSHASPELPNVSFEIMHDYPSSQPPNVQRNNFLGGPIQNFQPVPIALPYPTQYPQYGPAQRVPHQSHSFTESEGRRELDWWHEERPGEWDARNSLSSSGHLLYCTQLSYAPPRVLFGSGA